ncbi:MAG TPA: hypothetical protein VK929_02565 [Longimicrobiales bacterium]|nr:hypothetical protein [Longimicrobiales bacterium]
MIRRNITSADRDRTVVKWSLIAAAFALSVGSLAEATLTRSTEDTAKVVAEQAIDVEDTKAVRIAG